MIIRYEIEAEDFAGQDLSHLGIAEREIAELACAFRRIGFWRSDVESGLFYWSEGLSHLFGMPVTTGPISITAANAFVHPEDLGPLLEVLEQALSEKTAFHCILRMMTSEGDYRFMRSVGRYRKNARGKGEIIGMLYELFEPIRTVALAAQPPAGG